MTFVGLYGPWKVAVRDDDTTAAYTIESWLTWSEPGFAPKLQSEPQYANSRASVRALVEVYRLLGGMSQRALIGGELSLPARPDHEIRIGLSAGLTMGATAKCQSEFADALVPGLPSEFAQAALDGIVRLPGDRPASFQIIVDRAAYDEVNSSQVAYELAGGLLLSALMARWQGSDLDRSTLAEMSPR